MPASAPSSPQATHDTQGPSTALARLALVAVLVVAAGLRLWRLDQNGYGRQYYAAAVRSMLDSGHNFFFNAFDPAGFVSLDKPPLALWAQVASAKLLGFSAFAVMLPQVLLGVAAVALLHHLVARRFGRATGLVAALLLAVTPIAVAIDRSNNTESALIAVLLLATATALRAAERGSAGWLVVTGVLVGVGFNVKMAAAWVIVPTFGLAWLCAAHGVPALRRAVALVAATAALLVVSLAWVWAFDATPPGQRPYAGSTQHDSMLELALQHNGLDRFKAVGGRRAPTAGEDHAASALAGAPSSRGALYDRTPVGPLRLATPHLAGQMAWWLPLALLGAATGWRHRSMRGLSPAQTDRLVWTGWALSYGAAFSLAGGVFHTYYVALLAPALAALAAIGWSRLGGPRWMAAAVVLASIAWQWRIELGAWPWQADDWRSMLLAAATALGLASALALAVSARTRFALAGAAVALLALPLAWALSTVLVRPNVAAPAAHIAAYGAVPDADGDPAAAPPTTRPRARRLYDYLRSQRGGERFLVAVPNANQAAPYIVRTGEAVMAMGGYLGRDPILTPERLEHLVAQGELRFAMLGGYALVPPTSPYEVELARWIRGHGREVDPALWREPAQNGAVPSERTRRAFAPAQLFDLRPPP